MAVIMMSLIGLLFLATSTEGSYKKGVVISGESAYRCGDEFAFNNVHWWYDYHLSPWEHHKINCSDTIRSGYVPMAWKWRVHSPFYILQNAKYFLGFNEPNHPNQANMTPQEAAIHWKTIESKAHGKILVSPAVAHCSHCNMDPFAWLDSFFQHCPDCRVDHIATHDYHCHADDTMNYLKKLWERYHKPIWLTEFACPGNHGTSTQLAYMKDILPRLEAADYVYRYSWFVSRRTGNAYTTTHVSLLHQHSSSLTTIGQYYNDFM